MKEYTYTEYDREDMLALHNMTLEEVEEVIKSLDRGYFNRYVYPEMDDEFTTYTEDEYNIYKIRVALRKVYEMLERKGERIKWKEEQRYI